MRARPILQSPEYKIVNVLVTEAETGDYQQRVVLLKKPAETVGKGGVRLLPRLVVFLKGRINHFASEVSIPADDAGTTVLL